MNHRQKQTGPLRKMTMVLSDEGKPMMYDPPEIEISGLNSN